MRIEGLSVVRRPGKTSATPVWEMDRVAHGMMLWNQHRPDLDCSGKAVLGRIIRLQDVYLQAVETVLAPFGLKYPNYAAIATLRVQGDPFCMSPTALRKALLLSSGGLTKVLRKLEKDGLITRKADETDGRGSLVVLTRKGIELADKGMTAQTEIEQRFVSVLTAEEMSSTARSLSMMLNVVP